MDSEKWPEHGMSEDILKGIFLDGLREELKERVMPQRPATLDEVVTLVESWQQAVYIREAQRKALNMVKCEFCGVEGHELNTCEVRQRMKELWASKANGILERSDSTSPSVQCQCQRHQCWKKADREL
jgi:hypothetical protein